MTSQHHGFLLSASCIDVIVNLLKRQLAVDYKRRRSLVEDWDKQPRDVLSRNNIGKSLNYL